ncbi:E3 ubiquitin-protein ligase hrd1 [Chytriomyces hyalinus]
MSRLFTYGGISTVLAFQAISSAWTVRSNFYSTCIHLTRSSTSLLVLLNFAVFGAIMVGRTMQRIFFGQLRAIEVEHLYERSWYAVTETCLAMTLFRDQFDAMYLVLFGFLLLVKIFHWLVMDRVDFMEQAPTPPTRMFHVKMCGIIFILLSIDAAVLAYSIDYTTRKGPSMMLIFGFENLIMMSSVVLAGLKYIFHTIDLRSEHPWERKSMYIFYSELVIDLFKLCTYLAFFGIIMHYYGFPLHILRDLYMILRSFVQRCKDLVQYHRATRNMNERYPNATEAELNATDRVCIICREEMVAAPVVPVAGTPAGNVAKKLGCGHFFHLNCLRSWLERQQSCPTCRRSVLVPVPAPVVPAGPPPGAPAGEAANLAPAPGTTPAPPPATPALPSTTASNRLAALEPWQALMRTQHEERIHLEMAERQREIAERQQRTLESAGSAPANLVGGGPSRVFESTMPVAQNLGSMPHVVYPFTLTPLTSASVLVRDSPLESLTDAQLRALEGRSRDQIIARLHDVRAIQDQLAGLSVRLAQLVDLMPAEDADGAASGDGLDVKGKGKEKL